MVKPIPDGYSSVTPYLIFEDAKSAIDFYTKAFGAQELFRMPMGNRIAHAEMQIGNSRIMLADEAPQMDAYGPEHHHGSPVSLMLYVDDVDTFSKKAVAAGAKVQFSKHNRASEQFGNRHAQSATQLSRRQ